jgi:hypothetical protein
MVFFSIRQQICLPMTALEIKGLRLKGLKIPRDHKNVHYLAINSNLIRTNFNLLAINKLTLVR